PQSGVLTFHGPMVALARLIPSSRLGAGSPSAGNIAELDAIAACVIGGTSPGGRVRRVSRGGKGGVFFFGPGYGAGGGGGGP
ncbi:hypothetical protein M8371_33020, partial [Klebsiella pneumoniae]|nr:hypothetical protein [Klebsiella pneumoniae]